MTKGVELPSWNEGAARTAILDFVAQTNAADVPVADRIAVFDADGTLWCEKPAPVEADFMLRRLAEMAEADPTLRDRQPWKAARERDVQWLGKVISAHYAGDDTEAKGLLSAIAGAYANITVEDFQSKSDLFIRTSQHPTLGRKYVETAYTPMVELLALLEAHGFANHIVSGSGADFMRPITSDLFGIPPERVVGSSTALAYSTDGVRGTVTRQARLSALDDGPQKPLQIWSRFGRRPLVAGGNSNGDIPMLEYSARPNLPSLRLVVLHDDDEREFAYTSGAEKALEEADANGWITVSMKKDFVTVFAPASSASRESNPQP